MQLSDFICFTLFTISVTTTCLAADNINEKHDVAKSEKRIAKRETSVLIDNFPVESTHRYRTPTKIVYRRASKQRYAKPKPKYGPPRQKYGPPKRRPVPKKYNGKIVKSKHLPPGPKRRPQKPRYGPPKHPKPVYGVPKKPKKNYYPPEPVGFGEPPNDYSSQQNGYDYPRPNDYAQDFPPLKNYEEPPVDSYGSPIIAADNEPYPTLQSYSNSFNHFSHQDYKFGPEAQSWQHFQSDPSLDNTYAQSKKHPVFAKPDDDHTPYNNLEDFTLNSYADVFKHSHKTRDDFNFESKKVPHQLGKPDQWKKEVSREIVGGQYAEPPARYVPKFQPNAPTYNGDDDFEPSAKILDAETAASSASRSPYVNYKNSNIAFSPQNVNDAFSIVDKK